MIEKYLTWIELEIKKQKFGKEPASLYEPIHYLMGLTGKRLRPLLVLLAYSLYRKDVKKITPYAVAIEAFHNFTLMHDDIMDNAPLRRGNATVHEKWNTNTAILSGDVMLVKVYDRFLSLESKKLPGIFKTFNKCATEVCEGQQLDMEFETRNHVSEKEYLNMIRQKTAALLGFSLELGGILANTSENNRKALREFGINIGIGFQLKDDLMDAYADPEKFGKRVGGDIMANKKTYLLIKALETASENQLNELRSWLTIKKYDPPEKVKAVKSIFDSLHIQQLTEKKINSCFKKGLTALESVKGDRKAKTVLKEFAESLISRQS